MIGGEAKLKSKLQSLNGYPGTVHFRFGVTCYSSPMRTFNNEDQVTLVPPYLPGEPGEAIAVPVEEAVLIPDACAVPDPIAGYNGHLFLQTGAAEGSYNQSSIVLFRIL